MVSSIDLVGNTMKEIFVFETDQQLSQLEEILLAVEEAQSFSTDEISEVFRIMHTIKGSSAMMDYSNISMLAHSAENLFNIIRENNIVDLDYAGMCDIILSVTEFMKGEMIKVQNEAELDGDQKPIVALIDEYINKTLNGTKEVAQVEQTVEIAASAKVQMVIEPKSLDNTEVTEHNAFQVLIFFDEEAKMENMRAFTLVRDIKKHCIELSYYPEDIDTNNKTIEYIQSHGFEMFIETALSEEELKNILDKASFMRSYDVFKINDELASLQTLETSSTKYYINIFFDAEAKMENMRAFKLVKDLEKKVTEIKYYPEDIDTNSNTIDYIQKNGFEVNLTAELNEADLRAILDKSSFVTNYTIEVGGYKSFKKIEVVNNEAVNNQIVNNEVVNTTTSTPVEEIKEEVKATSIVAPKPVVKDKPQKAESAEFKNVNQSVISVNITKLDKVMDLIGEISVMQSVIINQQHDETQNEVYNAITRQLVKLTNELRDTVMSIRLLPVSLIFNNVNRIVRDMKRSLNKDVNFIVSGEETVLDKKIIDNLFDPIIHLVRNSMDHGIENRETRIASGKDEVGKIEITAESSGGYVTITIKDDGKGIDKEKVLNKAMSLGVVTKHLENLSENDILNLIFESGLSTKAEVTEFSGRGVGMDIVRKKVEEMSGNVFVSSTVGVGTTFTIKVPLTLAILEGVKIQVGESFFIIPSKMIEKTFKCDRENIITDTNDNKMVILDRHAYPIIKLSDYLNIESKVNEFEDGIMILVREDKNSVCVFVDVILGEIESIIKPIPRYLLKYSVKENGISGCTKLENGDLCLILDVSRIISSVL